jgi:hypothetical protein
MQRVHRPAFVIMNPKSGGGKVAKFGLSGKATKPGAQVPCSKVRP